MTHHHESPQAINGLVTHGYKSLGDFQTMATQSQQNTHTTTILFSANLIEALAITEAPSPNGLLDLAEVPSSRAGGQAILLTVLLDLSLLA